MAPSSAKCPFFEEWLRRQDDANKSTNVEVQHIKSDTTSYDNNFQDIGIPSTENNRIPKNNSMWHNSNFHRNDSKSTSSPEAITSLPPGKPGELSKRSEEVQRAKRLSDYPDSLAGEVFETTAMIVGNKACVKVSHMLLDPSAPAIFISAQAAIAARLLIFSCSPPKTFRSADGTTSTHDQHTTFDLYIAGIHATVPAYIDRGRPTHHHILFGKPGIKSFNASANFSCGPQKQTRWFLAQDTTGQRRKKVVLREDPHLGEPELHVYGRKEGLRLARQRGETAKERHSREVLERHEVRGQRLYARHGGVAGEDEDDDEECEVRMRSVRMMIERQSDDFRGSLHWDREAY